jgi:hypothetical protein
MAALTIQQVVRTGLVEALVAASNGGDSFANNGKTIFRVKNGHASAARTVTFASQLPAAALPQGAAKTDLAVVVAALTTVEIGVFDPAAFNDGTGKVIVTYSTEADLTVAAISQ